jgi:dipeptidyl aminopeptidase/acylaminoacyl peptidase
VFVRRSVVFSCALAAGTVAAPGFAPAADSVAPKTFSLEAARAIVTVSDPRISPDGTRVAYVRERWDFKKNVATDELALVDVASGTTRALTRDRDTAFSPRWSPSGDRLAFLASPASGKPPQIFILPMNGGDAQAITTNKGGVDAFAWKPDGSQIGYIADDDPPEGAAAAKGHDAVTIGDDSFLTRTAARPSHVWIVGADGTNAKALTSGAESAFVFGAWLEWSPNGSALIYPRQPDATFAHLTKTRVVAVDPATGAEHDLVAAPVDTFATFSHDGSKIAYVAPRHQSIYLENDAYVVDAATGKPAFDSLGVDRNEKWIAFLPDGSLGYAATDGVRDALWIVPPAGAAKRVDLGDVDFGADASVALDGTIAFVGHTRSRPGEVYVLPAKTLVPRRLSDDNHFVDGYTLGRSERIDWDTDAGMRACGVLTYPPDYVAGRTYPLVLLIHGGPVSASTWDFHESTQALAARGFLVFEPNYRGSDDLGDAFLQAIVGHPTSGPGRDNLAGLAAVEKLGIVDTSRIGVSGWSGGGLQTSWLIGHSHVWKAAVSGAGVDDWFEQAVLADINEEFADVFMGGATPWTPAGRALFADESPITYAGAITTPLLILSDTSDQRVPITQSYALFHALRDRGQRVRFVAFPRSGHFASDPVGQEAIRRTWYDWFSTELK